MLETIKKFFGTSHEREIKRERPVVARINDLVKRKRGQTPPFDTYALSSAPGQVSSGGVRPGQTPNSPLVGGIQQGECVIATSGRLWFGCGGCKCSGSGR